MERTTAATVLTCYIAAIVVLSVRLVLRKVYYCHLDLGDYLAILAIFTVATSIPFNYVPVIWGTANIDPAMWPPGGIVFTPEEIHRRTVGSKCVLVARVMQITNLWILKSILLVFYSKVVEALWYGRTMIPIVVVILAITYCLSVMTAFVECRPTSLYWTVVPNPDKCVRALKHIFISGALNIFTDFILIALPLPILFRVHLPLLKKLTLGLLFILGFFVIVVQTVRLVETGVNSTSQTLRILLASIEIMCACIVANTPALYATIRHILAPRDAVVGSRSSAWASQGSTAPYALGALGVA